MRERRLLELRLKGTVRYIKIQGGAGAPPLPPSSWSSSASLNEDGGIREATSTPEEGPFKEVYLVGTAHVSQDSAVEVKEVVELVQPDVLVVELCRGRMSMLELPDDLDQWLAAPMPSLYEMLLRSPPSARVSSLMTYAMSTLYREVGRTLGIVPGAEFRAGAKAARAIGSLLALGDRPVQVTLARTWHFLSFYQRLKLTAMVVYSLLKLSLTKEEVEAMKDLDKLYEMLLELQEHFPSLPRTLISERDDYLAAGILQAPGRRVVVVVGFGHLAGIMQRLEQNQAIDLEEISVIPVSHPWANIAFVATVLGILGSLSALLLYLGYWLIATFISLLLHLVLSSSA